MSYIDEKETALLVLAFPQLKDADRLWIDSFRKAHDPLFYGIVEPHFTIVFPTFGISTEDFICEVKDKIHNAAAFQFIIRCALMNHDRLSEYNHVFLSPDEGNSHFVQLHDRLYSGILGKTLRLDVDFCSHIGIGSDKDPEACKALVDEVNAQNIRIKGSVPALDIVSYGDMELEVIERVFLK